jgi:hypothetical protein
VNNKRATSVSKIGKNTTAVDIVNSRGDDIWDGEITNEDMHDIFNDRYGLLAVTLGVFALVLLCLIILTLIVAHTTEKRHAKAYRELQDTL